MTAEECRHQARDCRAQADRAFGALKADFLAAATTWDQLAEQIERSQVFGVVHFNGVPRRPR